MAFAHLLYVVDLSCAWLEAFVVCLRVFQFSPDEIILASGMRAAFRFSAPSWDDYLSLTSSLAGSP